MNVNKMVAAPEIPLKDFFRYSDKTSFKLSPKGNFIGYMKPWEDGDRMMNVYIKNIKWDVRFKDAKESF